MDIIIEPRFRDLIPPLTAEELSRLEQDVVKNGIRESLKVWKGKNVLVDGHHRYKLAQKHGLEYTVEELEFESDADAIWWMVNNQFERRNLNKTQQALIVADAEELVSSIRAEAKKKERLGGRETHSNQHTVQGFPILGNPAYTHSQHAPTIRESAHHNKTSASATPSHKPIHTNKILAEKAGVSHGMMDMAMAVKKHGDPELVEKMRSGEISANKAYQTVKREKKAAEVRRAQSIVGGEHAKGDATLYVGDSIGRTVECDLLLTDPPYSTDVEDIDEFVGKWLYPALEGVKSDGFAYVFIGAYPEELRAYLNARTPDHIGLCQVLVWTYKNTLGNNPKARYKQNWQACLFYRGVDAPDLDCPLTSEQWAVQEVNAPDGRLGDRYHAWQKPLELFERFIRHSTKEGDVVYDPFVCTGTTLVAAANLGRNGIGYEIDRENAEIAFERGVKDGGDVQ